MGARKSFMGHKPECNCSYCTKLREVSQKQRAEQKAMSIQRHNEAVAARRSASQHMIDVAFIPPIPAPSAIDTLLGITQNGPLFAEPEDEPEPQPEVERWESNISHLVKPYPAVRDGKLVTDA